MTIELAEIDYKHDCRHCGATRPLNNLVMVEVHRLLGSPFKQSRTFYVCDWHVEGESND